MEYQKVLLLYALLCFFFFNDTATTEIYTLSLHDALPISRVAGWFELSASTPDEAPAAESAPEARAQAPKGEALKLRVSEGDRKSTRLNSSHANISYAVFCLKKKKINPYIYEYSLLMRSPQ